jgi:hypothetical protein
MSSEEGLASTLSPEPNVCRLCTSGVNACVHVHCIKCMCLYTTLSFQAILTTCTPGGRTVAASSSGGPGSGAGGRGAGAAKSSPASSETLEQLAAAALWQLLLLGDETLQLEELFQVLPAASPAPAPAPAVDGDAGPGQQAEDCSLVTAVGPRLPLLQVRGCGLLAGDPPALPVGVLCGIMTSWLHRVCIAQAGTMMGRVAGSRSIRAGSYQWGILYFSM